jgi:NADPH2:quinone reductase
MMQSVLMTKVGSPDVLEVQEIETPEIKTASELLIRIQAAGVNPIDTKLRQGLYPMDNLPAVLGCDGSGIVDEVGPSVERFQAGDEVYFFHGGIGPIQGNYAEFRTLDERFVAHKPESLSFIEAAAAPLALITAWESLHDRAQIKTGQYVLIHAGAGGVGHLAIRRRYDD